MPNKKALWVFLGITFGVTVALAVIARLQGLSLVGRPAIMSQMVILGAMFIPALAAIICNKFILKRPFKELGFRWGPWKAYAGAYAVIVLLFAVNYAITWIFFVKPDFTLNSFVNQFAPPLDLPIPAWQIILTYAGITFIGAPIFNLLPSLGEEIGWRGFLLPALEPLGRVKAMVISGMAWALWHTPMILLLGFGYGKASLAGAALHFIVVTSLGIWMGDLWFKTRSTVLAGFIHSAFNANGYGVWVLLFVSANKLLIGPIGIIGAGICLALAISTMYKNRQEESLGQVVV